MTPHANKAKYLLEMPRKSGPVYYVQTRKGGRALRIQSPADSSEFWPEYGRLVGRALSDPGPISPTTACGRHKIAQLINAYRQSRDFTSLKPNTQKTYSCALNKIADLFGIREFRTLSRQDIRLAMDNMPIYAANQFLQQIRQLNDWCDQRGYTDTFPAAGIKSHGKSRTGFPAWSQEEVDTYLTAHPIGTQARLMIDLLRFTGMRVGDIIRLGPDHIRDGFIAITLQKNGVPVTIPLNPDLEVSIDATTPDGAKTFLTLDRFKRAFSSSKYFAQTFRAHCRAAGLEGTAARRAVSGHGLRKFALISVLENGGTIREAQALFGWRDAAMVQHYSEELDRERVGRTRGPDLML
ncbi:tyrosine-type recombinase/integrase [Roseibium sp. TrichSKD4]|uniref:tyrosine-type recombinase/integrase n=1 Tax=Roseibium sp. TrichSKD4 TaxID=744980 RepID=UPI00143B3BCE|nr:tyrosine-type recombinase/integrase [Roseibium sp. TrichSKD4]